MTVKEAKILGLQFENKINIGEIITIVSTFAMVIVMSFGIWKDLYDRTNSNKERIVVVEKTLANMAVQADKDRSDIKDDLTEIKDSIKDINKLIMEGKN